MASIPSELTLGCRPVFVPRTINEFLREISTIDSSSDRLFRIEDYAARLEDELRKIDAFKRELPLCMLLVNDAILALKVESAQCRKSRVEPVLEEFLPLKKSSDGDDDGGDRTEIRKEGDSREKMNWMSSAALWHGENHFTNNKNRPDADLRMTMEEAENSTITNDLMVPCRSGNIGNGFVMPFKRLSGFPTTTNEDKKMKKKRKMPEVAGLTLGTPGFKNPSEDLRIVGCCLSINTNISTKAAASSTASSSNSSSRKERRCWSPDLHERFINALQQLGGAQVATPKQIRELMQIDGLTNDEVKSHLQKYRLHARKVPSTSLNHSLAVLENLFLPAKCGTQSGSDSPQGPLNHQGGGMVEEEEEEADD